MPLKKSDYSLTNGSKLGHFGYGSAWIKIIMAFEFHSKLVPTWPSEVDRTSNSRHGNIQGNGRRVISKEAVGNSWDILYAILGHRHQNLPNTVISSEQTQYFQQKVSFMMFVSYSVPLLLSNIWSRSNFRVTVNVCRVLMSSKQTVVCWELARLHSVIKVTFVANVGVIR